MSAKHRHLLHAALLLATTGSLGCGVAYETPIRHNSARRTPEPMRLEVAAPLLVETSPFDETRLFAPADSQLVVDPIPSRPEAASEDEFDALLEGLPASDAQALLDGILGGGELDLGSLPGLPQAPLPVGGRSSWGSLKARFAS